MDNKSRLKLVALLGLNAGCHAQQNHEPSTKHPNIVFIMSDDHAYQAISAYRSDLSKLAPTPNIDRIANNGMRFDRCLVTNSLSGPSRACILTGKYSHENGFLMNEGGTRFDSSQQTFPKLLQQAGYQTAIVGKWHLYSNPTGFDYWEIFPGQGNYYNPDMITTNGTKQIAGYATELVTQKSIEWLKHRDVSKPFMLMVYHKAPHRNWMPGPHELGLYEQAVFPEPSTLFDDYSGRGKAEHEQDMNIEHTMETVSDLKMSSNPKQLYELERMNELQRKNWNSIYNPLIQKFNQSNLQGKDLVKWKYQRYMRDYLACIAGVDKSVGEILDYLKQSGLDKNTIIIYTSDQGFYLGEHGWFDKRFMFEESERTPLLIEWNNVVKPHSVNNDLVSNLDFAETFLDIAGVKIPKDMQGESMLPVIKGNTPASWRKEHYYHYYEYPGVHKVKRHYGITTDRYKLIHFYYDIDEWELFDLKNDPNELKNEFNNPKYADVKKDLMKRLKTLMEKYHDSDALAHSYLPLKK
jgi:arylsulfatase A-like enzyme